MGLGVLGGGQPAAGPPPPPPEVPPRAAPKVECDAFLDLDPLGDKVNKDVAVRDMFKDFQMARPPPAVPARKGELEQAAHTRLCLLACLLTPLPSQGLVSMEFSQ